MTKFILPSEPKKLEKIDIEKLTEIENEIFFENSISEDNLNMFLDYLVYITREKIDPDFENATYKNKCNRAQCMIHYYLEKLGVEHYLNRSFDSITKGIADHSFVVAIFNVNGEDIPYIIDPTYRQFFEEERCNKMKLTPGNFIKKEDEEKAITFLKNGYMTMNEENTKMYGNSLYFTKENLPEPKIEISGNVFAKVFLKGNSVISKTEEELKKEDLYIEPLIEKNPKKTL